MIGILMITHGTLGDSLLECANHMLGKTPPQIASLAVSSKDDPGSVVPKAMELVASVNSGDGVLVLSDMYGATPCNIVTKILQPGVVEGVAGVNLPMLVRVMNYRQEPLPVLVDKALSGGREGVVAFDRESCERFEQGSVK
ncbi:PTS sugar transporter subunit IIA [Methylotenera sp. G11]|uniref:PTS sugar transporter subunit IIA n=1 Tax=Methylotenera sp. G11 TaxID=1506585 RepID=UPI000648E9EA|nr:PTS sugar transporter subunit IIA [Methylotenera sp. G11]